MASQREREEEECKIRRLQFLVDFACVLLYQDNLTLEEGYRLVAGVKRLALTLFPDKESTFDMIYGARFHRILSERFFLI